MSLLFTLPVFVTRHCLRLLPNHRVIPRPRLAAGNREFSPWASPFRCGGRRCWPCRCSADCRVSDRDWRRAGSEWKQSWHPSCARRTNYTDVGSGPRGPLLRGRMRCGRRERAALQRKRGEQQHLGASIIYKTPAATKAKRDQNQENSIA